MSESAANTGPNAVSTIVSTLNQSFAPTCSNLKFLFMLDTLSISRLSCDRREYEKKTLSYFMKPWVLDLSPSSTGGETFCAHAVKCPPRRDRPAGVLHDLEGWGQSQRMSRVFWFP